jgi:predicted PurR-regulated permease PerM
MKIEKLAYLLVCILITGFLLQIGSFIVLPLLYAVVFSTFLYPLDQFLLKKVKVKWISILLSFASFCIVVGLIFLLFSVHLIDITKSLPSISGTVQEGFNKIMAFVEANLPLFSSESFKLSSADFSSALSNSIDMFTRGLISSGNFLFNFFLVFIYTFFLLYYRRSFKNFIVYRFEKEDQSEARKVLREIKSTVQAYIGGLGLVVVILAILNSIGLWLIGIDYPLFWGVLGGVLAIIPYIGTVIGGLLPLLYSIATTDTLSQPIMIVVYYILIQSIEGNLITPKVVGDKVDINPLVSILALIFFGNFWGVGGVILALPIISVVRIILGHLDSTRDIAILMSSGVATFTDKVQHQNDTNQNN